MRTVTIFITLGTVLTTLLIMNMLRRQRNERESLYLVHYVEAYYKSMMPPQIDTKDAFAWFTGLKVPVFNSITHFYYTKNQGKHLDQILQIAPKDKPISIWVEELQDSSNLVKELTARDFKKIVTCPFMTWQVTEIKKPAFTIKRTDAQTFASYNALLGKIFGLDNETEQGFGKLQSNSSAENYLIYIDTTPVGTGTLFVTGNVGLLLNIGVHPEYQKQGLGTAISQFLMHRAYELKLKKVVLNANPVAFGMYQKLGFKKDHDLDIYAK